MSDPLNDRAVRRRLAVLRHAEEVSGNVAMTCHYFGTSRQLYSTWLRRYRAVSLEGCGISPAAQVLSGRPRTPRWSTARTGPQAGATFLARRLQERLQPGDEVGQVMVDGGEVNAELLIWRDLALGIALIDQGLSSAAAFVL
jgi:hypothetical protein